MIGTGGDAMKLIIKENPDVELTVTVEYPKQSTIKEDEETFLRDVD